MPSIQYLRQYVHTSTPCIPNTHLLLGNIQQIHMYMYTQLNALHVFQCTPITYYTYIPSVSSLLIAGMTRLQSGPSAQSNCHTQNCSNESNCKLLAGSGVSGRTYMYYISPSITWYRVTVTSTYMANEIREVR